MKILGVDQSLTSTGWCLLEGGELIEYGLISSSKNDDKFSRMFYVAEEVNKVAVNNKADIIIVEGLPFGNMPGNVGKDLAGLQSVIVGSLILNFGYELDKDVFIPPPTTIKKLATESGKAKKEDMFDALPKDVYLKFQSTPKSRGRYDLTDAYWLAKFGEKYEK